MVLLLLTAALAGCIGEENDRPDDGNDTDTTPPGEGAGETPTGLVWTLNACSAVIALAPVDAGPIQERLPANFTPQAPEEFGLPPDVRGEALFGIETFQCTNGTGLNGTIDDLAYGSIFIPVHPPENLTLDSMDLHFVKYETLIPDEPRRTLLQDAGLPAVDGSTDLSGLQATPAGHLFDASLTLGEETFTFTGSTNQPMEDFREGVPFVEFQPTSQDDDALAIWLSTENVATDATQGTGTLGVPAGSWAEEVIGAQATQAWMIASTDVNFITGAMALPTAS